LATDNGIAVIDGEGQLIDHLTSDQGLLGREALCMAWQGQDTLWVGTDAGCASLQDGVWHRHPACPRGPVLAIATAPNGTVYLGTYRHGVVVYDGHQAHRYHHANSRLPHDMVTAILVDHPGRVWAGTAKGVFCMDMYGDTQKLFTTDNSGLRSNRVTDLATDGQQVFIATDGGIAAWSPGGIAD
jgi:ligand-binding sensor domain-containing protein